MEQQSEVIDYAIIGAGPAGLQTGYFLAKNNMSYRIFESGNSVGTFFRHHPVHRTLISINKRFTGSDDPEFNLRHDWNSLISEDGPKFTDYSNILFPHADDLVHYLGDFAIHHNLNIAPNHKVSTLKRDGEEFLIEFMDKPAVRAKRVIIATGLGKSRVPDIKGVELAEQYEDISTDPCDYENQRVLIIGKGNSAFETADAIVNTAALIHLSSPTPINLAWNTHYVGHLRAINNSVLDMYQLKSQHASLDANISELKKTDDGMIEATIEYLHANDEVEYIKYDRVIMAAGFQMQLDFYDDELMPETTLKDKYPVLTPAFESVNQPNLFYAGTLTHSLDFRKATSGFIHGFRYNCMALVNILKNRFHGEDLHHTDIEADPMKITDHALARIGNVSSLWQQPGFLADFYTISKDGVKHYDVLPMDFGVQHAFKDECVVCQTFEYGHDIEGDIFRQERISREDVSHGEESKFLHPVFRLYKDGMMTEEYHVIEDLEADWNREEHGEGIDNFFKVCMQSC